MRNGRVSQLTRRSVLELEAAEMDISSYAAMQRCHDPGQSTEDTLSYGCNH